MLLFSVFLLSFLVSIEATAVRRQAVIGTSPKSLIYSEIDNVLYCADPIEQKIYQINLITNAVTSININCGPPNAVVPIQDSPGYIVVTIGQLIYITKFIANGSFKLLTSVDSGKPDNYIDFATIDGKGYLWVVTNSPTNVTETAYIITEKKYALVTSAIRPYVYASPFAWSPDYTKVYFIDTSNSIIYVFDFNLSDGRISNQQVFFDFEKITDNSVIGTLNYVVVDTKGNLFVAVGNKIVKISSTGKFLLVITIADEVTQVSSLAFGGKNYASLYVTCVTQSGGAIYVITALGATGKGLYFDFDAESYYNP